MKRIVVISALIGMITLLVSPGVAQPNLVSFSPSLSYIWVGDLSTPTIPTPLTVSLDAPALADIFISISSSDNGSLSVVGGGVTIPAGNTSGVVLLNGIAQNSDVQLTASLLAQQLTADVRVVATNEVPQLIAMTPSSNTIQPGDIVTITVQLDIPSYSGTTVNLSLSPGNSGTIPASVDIPANQTSSQFTYNDGSVASVVTITGDLGPSQSSTVINVSPATSVDEPISVSYSVFPNPFSNQISLTTSVDEPLTIMLYSAYTQVVFEESFSKSININTEQMKEGVYFYKLKNSNGVVAKGKIIKK